MTLLKTRIDDAISSISISIRLPIQWERQAWCRGFASFRQRVAKFGGGRFNAIDPLRVGDHPQDYRCNLLAGTRQALGFFYPVADEAILADDPALVTVDKHH